MTPNPIRKVLSTIRKHQVQALLMGGQACVFYGAAEFSRDIDLAVLCRPENLALLRKALTELEAEVIAVPPFQPEFLEKGHAVHFRCRHAEAAGLRIDVMSTMRGVGPFPDLWERRTTIATADGDIIDLMSLPDLVQAKKTQRDKDWPVIRRLLEAHYARFRSEPTDERLRFWLQELRTPLLLLEVISEREPTRLPAIPSRPWLVGHPFPALPEIEARLQAEEQAERETDRAYWASLRKELESLRHASRRPVMNP